MCGLVAIISKKEFGFDFKSQTIFEQMLYADALRGEDSTGIYGINKYGNLRSHKSAKHAYEFLQTKSFQDFKSDMFKDYRIVVGHNRAATKGAVKDENAHPWIEDHICLVHNGTLTYHKNLADTEVDSHAICKAFAKKGYKETLPEIMGAFALIWYDAKEKQLCLARNSQRPLWIVETPEADYYSSESEMLLWLLKRNLGKEYEAKYLGTDRIYKYDLDNLKKGYYSEEMPTKKAVPVVVSQPAQQQEKQKSQYNQYGNTSSPGYSVGQRIEFSHETNTVVNGVVYINGHSFTNPEHKVKGALNTFQYTAEQLENILEDTNVFSGSYAGYSVKNGVFTYFVNNCTPVEYYTSCNGVIVSSEDIKDAGNCCHSCGTLMDPEEDDKRFWVRMKNGNIKAQYCGTCVEKHPILSNYLDRKDTECTNESQSLDTTQDQPQSGNLHLC